MKRIINIKILLSFMKTFAISEDYSESRVILFWFPLVLLIDFSCVYPLLDAGENPGNVLCIHVIGGFQNFQKRLSEQLLERYQ
jgi:hypothetical protein